ncbi:unnamed protein product, partial [Medioppia subpectinata]
MDAFEENRDGRRRIATTPRNPWEGVRIVKELQLVGEFGLRNKTELWTHLTMVKSHKSQAKKLLITTNKEEFMTEGRALLNYLYKMGIISGVDYNDEADISRCLKEVLNLDLSHYLNRRLQSLVFKAGLATNIHHARCLIVQKQITVMGRVVNKP